MLIYKTMNTYYLTDFNEENFKDINKWLDDLWDEEWQIYINSDWWDVWVTDALIYRLEKYTNITLIWVWLCSSAFDLFYNFKWKKELRVNAKWMVHSDAVELDVFMYKWIVKVRTHKFNRKILSELEANPYDFLTEEEKTEFIEWEDIYLNYERLKLIFNK